MPFIGAYVQKGDPLYGYVDHTGEPHIKFYDDLEAGRVWPSPHKGARGWRASSKPKRGRSRSRKARSDSVLPRDSAL